MNLNNFHKHISHIIYGRGEDYYESGMIDKVEHDSPDTWTAEVEGNDLYSVEIKFSGHEIISWDCDCPYDGGDICKHVVAVLLYIKDNRDEHPVTVEVPLSSSQEQLTEILKQSKNKIDYTKEIQKCFKLSYDNYGFQFGGQAIAYKLDGFIEKAKSLIKLNYQEEAMTILLHIISEIGDGYEEYDDYDGDLGAVCQDAVKLIAEMIETGLPDDLLKDLTDEISQLIKNSNYDKYDLADLNELLILLSIKSSDFDNGISIIDEVLTNEPDSFRSSSLVKSKIKLLENAGKKDEVKKVILFYLYLPEIRKIRLKELISEKQYDKALALIDEGIRLAEKKGHSGTISKWKNEKLSVYQLMGK